MRTKLLDEARGRRTFMVAFGIGDEVADGLLRFADENGVDGASFTGLGALRRATLAWWNWESKGYEHIAIDEQVEVLSLTGNITRSAAGGRKVHAHIVAGLRDGSTRGGHLVAGQVRPTLEVMVRETPAGLTRRIDEVTGLELLDL